VIAHRLSTIRRADLVIVIEGGQVVERGQHAELLSREDSVYSKLYATQVFDSEMDSLGDGRIGNRKAVPMWPSKGG
jgi:ABC-type glutathione transport system ATPase component